MMSFKHFAFAGAGMLFSLAPAAAQTPAQRVVVEQLGSSQRQEGSVRVQANVTFFVPGATGDSEEAQKSRERAQRAVYQMAAHECDLLRDVLAKDCRMNQSTAMSAASSASNSRKATRSRDR